MIILAALFCSTALAASANLPETRRILDRGLWNSRIEALYDLGELGRDALPLLVYSSDDADWQVRLTAVHFLGKIGPEAAPALAEIVRVEPCPNVRISALRWLSGMGRSARPLLESVLTPEDQSEMESQPDRYGTERMGKPLVIDAPDGMSAEFFNGGIDLRICASSEHSGRMKRRLAGNPQADISAKTAPAPPITGKSTVPALGSELDAPRTPKRPESLPPGELVAERPRPQAPDVGFETPQGRALGSAEVPAPRLPAETLPESPLLPTGAVPAQTEVRFEADAGTGRPENDPLPFLIAQLSSAEPRRRARAADELGKRGAATAVPALRRALSDRDRRVRASAVLALGNAGGADAVRADLRRALRDKDEDVRFSAEIALERLARASR